MKKLYVPWRTSYTKSVSSEDPTKTTAEDCVFCKQFLVEGNETNFILKRYKHFILMLNRYPYNAGHLLLIPMKHVANLDQLTPEEHIELITVMSAATTILQKTLENHGTNIGINLGRAAGAGIPNHLHVHILPRWTGDTNFLPVLADTKTISVDLHEVYNKLKAQFENA